jgi:hypothetical protein
VFSIVKNGIVLKIMSLFCHKIVGHKILSCKSFPFLFVIKDWGLIEMAWTSIMCIGKDNVIDFKSY